MLGPPRVIRLVLCLLSLCLTSKSPAHSLESAACTHLSLLSDPNVFMGEMRGWTQGGAGGLKPWRTDRKARQVGRMKTVWG